MRVYAVLIQLKSSTPKRPRGVYSHTTQLGRVQGQVNDTCNVEEIKKEFNQKECIIFEGAVL
jgi:hypothetical protein